MSIRQSSVSTDPSSELHSPTPLLALSVAALVLAAVNLRPAISGVGALLPDVSRDLAMGPSVAGALTALPSLCFAVAGTSGRRLARLLGPATAIAAALLVLTAGLLGRALAGDVVLFLLGSAVAVAAIGVVNVLMPVAVREYAGRHVGTVTGTYSVALTAGAALAAGVSVPLASAFGGWRASMAWWALPALVAVPVWLLLARRRRVSIAAPVADPVAASVAVAAEPSRAPARRPAAWALALFFGLQAAGAYVVMGWLPALLQGAGVAADRAGLMLAAVPAVGVPFAFLVPAMATTSRRRVGLVVALGVGTVVAYAGLLLAPTQAPWVWAAVLGVSQATFPLALAFIGLGGRDAGEVARLSAFAQGIGYLVATPFPFFVGVLHASSGGWAVPLALMIVVAVAQTGAGVVAARGVGRP